MKNILFLSLLAMLFAIALSNVTNAQIVTTLTPIAVNDTLTNTDTAWVYIATSSNGSKTFSTTASVVDHLSTSATVRVIKVSGTVAGTVTFAGSNDATNWETIGTALTVTDVADQVKTFEMRSTSGRLIYAYYRAVFISSGTNVQIPKVYFKRGNN